MKNTIAVLAVTLVWMAGGSTAVRGAETAGEEAATLGEAVTDGKLLLNLRPRYEYVEQANKPKDANAFTMRSLLGWRTKPWHGLSVTAEGINVTHFGEQDYNDLPSQAAASPYPTVAEPPVEPLRACAGTEADEVVCETSGARCDAGDEVCACWLEDAAENSPGNYVESEQAPFQVTGG